MRHGRGIFTWPDGSKYEGDFKQGFRTGNGTTYFPEEDIYVGEFLNGEMHGIGIYNYENGRRYE